MRQIEPLPVIAPGKFLDEFLGLLGITDRGKRGVAHLVKAENAVPDIGRQPGHRAIEMIAACSVGARIDGGQRRLRGGAASCGDVGKTGLAAGIAAKRPDMVIQRGPVRKGDRKGGQISHRRQMGRGA